MRILHLTLKKKWFDLIAVGDKTEEYREVKNYWWTRLVLCGQFFNSDDFLLPVSEWKMLMSKTYDVVQFKNGYGKNAPTMTIEFDSIEIGTGKTEWGAEEGKEYFVIKLGKLLSTNKTV